MNTTSGQPLCALEMLALATGQNFSDLKTQWHKKDDDKEAVAPLSEKQMREEKYNADYLRIYGYLPKTLSNKEFDEKFPNTDIDFLMKDLKKPSVVKRAVVHKPKKEAKPKKEIVRPTFHLAEIESFTNYYTLFKHERGGFCKYAVYNNTANHYVACDFDGEKIIGGGSGTIYKTLNAWTTANWKEQRIKDGNNKTTRNNAYRETKYIPLQMVDNEEMVYGPLHEKIEWLSSLSIEKK